ncbi:MAG: hypothetical protein ACKVQS_05980 [Fimbriimonadaceae bacterium]
MKGKYPSEWRTQSLWKKRFYARYMKWLERIGYAVVALVIGAFIFAFNYRVDDVITADQVPIRASVFSVQLGQPVVVVKSLALNFSDVKKGQPILEIVEGEEHVDRYLAWKTLQKIGSSDLISQPVARRVLADRDGVLFVDDALIGVRVDAQSELAQIRDYSQLLLSAKLIGQGVANAKQGGEAKLKSLSISSASGVLLRAKTKAGSIVSGRLLSDDVVEKLSVELKDMPLTVRDDIPFQVVGVSKLDIDALMNLQNGGSGDGLQVDPSALAVLKADVVSGEHMATVQFANLPASIQERVNQIIEGSLKDRVISNLSGELRTVQNVSDLNTVFQVKAVPGSGGKSGGGINGTAITRVFEAELKIQSPPDYLMRAVRSADQEGQTVTVKVEVKTGDRPIATLLLKRS